MERARLLLVASGTATLQAALAGTPMVVVYKTGEINYRLARLLVKVEHIAMPNLIAGREVVPELIQREASAPAVAREGLALLEEGPERRRMLPGLELVRRRMGGPGASRRVAALARELMTGSHD
jgi:lipid-A-disaccharide synthase